MGVISAARPYLPGIAFLAVGAILSHLIAGAVDGLQPLVVAVGIGALVGNTAGTPDAAEPGVGVDKLFLETGIVLLGAAVVIEEFLAAGPTVLGLVVVAVGGGLLLAEAIARGLFRLDGTTPSLLAAGASICGVSAVVAIGRVLDARGSAITFAAATVLLFDAVTLVAFPIAGEWLGLTGRQFGVWAGVSMFSTGPVAAAGFAHSTEAGQWATVTKLARNSLLGASRSPTRSRTPRGRRPSPACGGCGRSSRSSCSGSSRSRRSRTAGSSRRPRWSRSDGCRTRSSRWRSSASGSRSGSGRCARSAGPPSARSSSTCSS